MDSEIRIQKSKKSPILWIVISIIFVCIILILLFVYKKPIQEKSLLKNTGKNTSLSPIPSISINPSQGNNRTNQNSPEVNASLTPFQGSNIINKYSTLNRLDSIKPVPTTIIQNQVAITSPSFTNNPSSPTANNSGSQNRDTSSWKSFSNTIFGYSLKYPQDWVSENTTTSGLVQSTNFHTLQNPNTVIVIFYIRQILPFQNQIFQSSDKDGMQSTYHTKIHISSKNLAYSYQCIPVLDNSIVETCSAIEQTIAFDN